eukprot:5427_1
MTKYDTTYGLQLIKRTVSQKNFNPKDLFCIYNQIIRPNNTIRDVVLRSLIRIFPHHPMEHLLGHIDAKRINYQWVNALMKICLKEGNHGSVLSIYTAHNRQLRLNDISYIYALKACIHLNDCSRGQQVIHDIQCTNSIELSNCLIHFYGHFEHINDARSVFESMKHKQDIVSINSMMKAYNDNAMYDETLLLYDESDETIMNAISCVLVLKACSNINTTDGHSKGLQLIQCHRLNTLQNVFVQNTLIAFYGKCGQMEDAFSTFHSIEDKEKNTQTINAMMSVCCDCQQYTKCIELFTTNHHKPSIVTYIIAIKAYGAIGDMKSTQQCFDEVRHKTSECVNCVMDAFIANDLNESALGVYDEYPMLHSQVSHLLALKACSNTMNVPKGEAIIAQNDGQKCDINLKNAMIDFYGKIGDVKKALNMYCSITDSAKDVVSFNSMLSVYVDNKLPMQCVLLFQDVMKSEQWTPNVATYVIMLKLCTQRTIYHFGKKIHLELQNKTEFESILKHPSVQINLIYFYGKCGQLELCKALFDAVRRCDYTEYCNNIDIWNALIHSYGRNGYLQQAMDVYELMKQETDLSTRENSKMHIIYTSLIHACNHAQRVDQALHLWHNQISHEKDDTKYNKYTICGLVDCFARSGRLKQGHELLIQYEQHCGAVIENPNDGQWMALLSGCNKYNDKAMADMVYNQMKTRYFTDTNQWKSHMASASILLSNIYAFHGEYDRVECIRNEMKTNDWHKHKEKAVSEIEIDATIHQFIAGDWYQKDERYECIAHKLNDKTFQHKLKHFGYTPDLNVLTREIEDEQEAYDTVYQHSEKLAALFGLIQTDGDQGYAIVINKNLRICSDCHQFMKALSQIERRTLIVTDTNRVHTFDDGVCSCNDCY